MGANFNRNVSSQFVWPLCKSLVIKQNAHFNDIGFRPEERNTELKGYQLTVQSTKEYNPQFGFMNSGLEYINS
jgi:hypothetical protein